MYEIDIYLVNVIPVYYFRVSGIKLHCFMNQHWDYSQPLNQLSRDWSQSSVKLLHRSLLPCQQINIFAIFLKLIVIIYFVLITQKSCFSLLKCVFLRFFLYQTNCARYENDNNLSEILLLSQSFLYIFYNFVPLYAIWNEIITFSLSKI